MKHSKAIFGTIAGTALTLACVESYAATNPKFDISNHSEASSIILLADNSSNMGKDEAIPAMGGEGDNVPGGNAPNPDPDRTAETVMADASITASVKSKLLADSMMRGLKIDVDTRSGVVYLTGDNMKSQSAIDQAMKLAEGTEGVTSVVSRLAIGDIKN